MLKEQFHAIDEKTRLGRTLEGIAYYASVHTPNMSSVKKFKGDPYYVVNLGLDKENIAKAESYGLTVFPPEGIITEPYVKIKRKIKAPKTADDVKIDVVDTAQQKIPPSILIGNKSKVRCKFTTYWFDNHGGGVGTGLYKVQVVDLVPFKPTDTALLSDGSGFKVADGATDIPLSDDLEDVPDSVVEEFSDPLPWETSAETSKVAAGLFD